MDSQPHIPSSPLGESVVGDLKYLARNWTRSLDEETVRRDSAVLRRLLLDHGKGTLRQYRQELGLKGEPKIRAIDLKTAVPGEWSDVVLGAAGGATIDGFTLALIDTRSQPLPEPQRVVFPTRQFRLSEFLDVPCMIVAARAVNRREVIQYVANKLGGVHFDQSRKPKESVFEALDTHRRSTIVFDVDLVHFELLAIGQHLLRSSDIARLLPSELRLNPAMPGVDQEMSWKLVEGISVQLNATPPAE
jgi:hypothetical protein